MASHVKNSVTEERAFCTCKRSKVLRFVRLARNFACEYNAVENIFWTVFSAYKATKSPESLRLLSDAKDLVFNIVTRIERLNNGSIYRRKHGKTMRVSTCSTQFKFDNSYDVWFDLPEFVEIGPRSEKCEIEKARMLCDDISIRADVIYDLFSSIEYTYYYE
jgi:hypothetical protein